MCTEMLKNIYEILIFELNLQVAMTDWRMTFLPAFRMCVEAGTYNLMCSYNR